MHSEPKIIPIGSNAFWVDYGDRNNLILERSCTGTATTIAKLTRSLLYTVMPTDPFNNLSQRTKVHAHFKTDIGSVKLC